MKKQIAVVVGLMVLLTGGLFAQTHKKDVTMTVTLSAWYDLNITNTTVAFKDEQPNVSATPGTKSISGDQEVDVRVFAVANSGSEVYLYVQANGDLKDGTKEILIGAITWTASGDGLKPGMMSTAAASEAGYWTGKILHWHEGAFAFSFLRDYANQEPGEYTATATYTLSVV